jgi:hypothetical protein
MIRPGPTGCRSAAASALHQKALKFQRSRAPKAVNCKRLLGGTWSIGLQALFTNTFRLAYVTLTL